MRDNLATIIETLRIETVDRCRERIDRAAKKATAVLGRGDAAGAAGKESCEAGNHGVTAAVKHRHGL